jgi:hypothetical protein
MDLILKIAGSIRKAYGSVLGLEILGSIQKVMGSISKAQGCGL